MEERSAGDFMKNVFNDAYERMRYYFLIFLYKSISSWYLFELPQLVEAIQTSTHNIQVYKEVDKSTLVLI